MKKGETVYCRWPAGDVRRVKIVGFRKPDGLVLIEWLDDDHFSTNPSMSSIFVAETRLSYSA